MLVRLKRGLDLPISGSPVQSVNTLTRIESAALLSDDYVSVDPELVVKEGDRVVAGEPIFKDRVRPKLIVSSPISGVVSSIVWRERNHLAAVVIQRQGNEHLTFNCWHRDRLNQLNRRIVSDALLNSGLWTSLRSRPFGRIPDPDSEPFAIYVTAIDSNPLAPDPGVILQSAIEDFNDGVIVLSQLTHGKVYVCTSPDWTFNSPNNNQICRVSFAGPAGLVGTHIHFLTPRLGKKSVWYINYQDVIAIGQLFTSGQLRLNRTISLAGPQVMNPRLVEVPCGANINDIVSGELAPGKNRIISGSVLNGREISDNSDYLGRYHSQVSVLSNENQRVFLGWLAPGSDRFSATRMFLSSFLGKRLFNMNTALNGSPRAFVPVGSYEKVTPQYLLINPLLKALLVADTETAKALGCLDLEEEDLALCSYVCCSKHDFGVALRETLSIIERTG